MKKQLKRIGFFRELPYGSPEGLSIDSSFSEFSLEKRAKVIAYLRSGTVCVVSPGLSRDVVSAERNIIGSLSLLTDGVFLWPSDLAYYIEKYSVGIPQEFLEHMEQNAWVISTDIDIHNLEL
ncbi:hypothetical protein [Rhizobium leguminosarum]|uniref:Uncharacterized protein n=1 Tax=Rhizobium leguminosarum TaxID=384 RepID=A0A2K9ZF24_RHILE|nr:hypothetical protein [Rhizobium leguminosarum]AUW46865.1 hypothetical protein CUJ84_pRLN2000327 [Rhizobium leguminosarum]